LQGIPLIARHRFPDLGDSLYLYTGAHAPALDRVTETLACAHRWQSRGPAGRIELFEAEQRARAGMGKLVGRAVADVAFVGDTSTAWNAIANGLSWEPGDNVVLNEFEHPSVVYAWLRLKSRGLEVRVVPRDAQWQIEPAAIASACDERTRAIAASQVGYVSGFRHNTSALAAIARRVGAPLFLDVSHALGVVPVAIADCAIAVGASYKWLLGPYGVGVVIWNRDWLPAFEPGAIGWRSTADIFTTDRFERVSLYDDARRFQLGAPSFAGIAALGVAVDELLTLGTDAIEAHASLLAGHAIDKLTRLGLPVVTPADPDHRAGNVAFLHPSDELVAGALADRGILVWAGDGRVRASFHVMNSRDEVDAFALALADVLARFPIPDETASA
jgi:selenocysteine lyase/cysteine desulfurase